MADWIDTIYAIIPYSQSNNFIRKFTIFSKIVRFLFRKTRDLYQIQFNYNILVGKRAAVTMLDRHYQLLLISYQLWAKLAFQMDIIGNKIDLIWENWTHIANLPRKSQTKIGKEILILFFQYFFG